MAVKYVMDRDLGMKKIMAGFAEANKTELIVGVLEGSKNGEGFNIAEYAAANEYGTDKIPSRPFMRTAFDENKQGYIRYMNKMVKQIGQVAFAQMATTLGLKAEKDIQQTITGRNFLPKLADSTVKAKKGSTKTLVDSSAMVNSIKHLIRK